MAALRVALPWLIEISARLGVDADQRSVRQEFLGAHEQPLMLHLAPKRPAQSILRLQLGECQDAAQHTLADQFVNATVEIVDGTIDYEHRRWFGANHLHSAARCLDEDCDGVPDLEPVSHFVNLPRNPGLIEGYVQNSRA